MMKRLLAGISVALLAIFAVACGSNGAAKQSSSNGSKIQVVASLDFYGEVAKAVGGNKVSVQSIINNPAVDPHDYEPTTKVGKSVASADLVVASGMGYDGWMDKVVKSADKSKNYLRVADDLMNKKEGDNEHIWYDPRTMPKLANTLADKFAKKDPADKATFKANAKKYIASLDDLNTLINKLKSKVNGQLVDVSEPVFGYALDYLGYKVNDDHFSKSTEDGTDYSAKDIHGIETDIKEKKIAFFVNNIQASSKTVNQLVKLAEQNNVPVLKVTETLPKGKNYRTWMTSQYQQLEKIQDQATNSAK
ncbi:metal ABC transporter solute-binding protein [Lacticaseibacillus paracasei]|uniref:metal ABC transporter solute-binding protein n=1 Tax=Lacticaseibacillus paracasei TaxID=1597 RepID=UPI00124B184B|nr:metal ABC transporter solute-binding protein [Lacticaseibacillus paracasei]KAB1963700.1 metal ABC transporter substrate-binding protein [Lacticaseibacillus paracasei]MCT3332830.1 metal ABC transporter substrate-binding protein [Lacticaseibacillus paracasei]WPP12143.1 metal ABC transporter solute-binding protein [Lacticaseibacillus paracasei]WQG47721.1 metal ABC transporter solute-binding protein [Lacticaseibacillus casei]